MGGVGTARSAVYFGVPSLFMAARAARAAPRASLIQIQASTVSHYFLAELFLDQRRIPEARAELQRVIDAPVSADWAPEDRDYKQKAAALLPKVR